MSMGGAMFAVSAAQAVNQISAGYAQKAENNANASIIESNAGLLDTASEVEQGRYVRQGGQYESQATAIIGKQGIMPEGSAMAAMVSAEKNIRIDAAIAKFNVKTQQNAMYTQAAQQRNAGKAAVRSGYAQGFSSLLSGASKFGLYSMKQGSGFDSSTLLPMLAGG